MIIENLFPTPIGIFDFDGTIDPSVVEYVASLDKRKTDNNKITDFSLPTNLLSLSNLQSINQFITNSLNAFFHAVFRPKYNVYPLIHRSWATYTMKGEHHHRHWHHNSLLSGVFYLQVNENDCINFYCSNAGNYLYNNTIRIHPDEYNEFNSWKMSYKAIPNRLLIFPSNVEHSTDTVVGDKLRISIAFDSFVKGELGDDYELNRLIIM